MNKKKYLAELKRKTMNSRLIFILISKFIASIK